MSETQDLKGVAPVASATPTPAPAVVPTAVAAPDGPAALTFVVQHAMIGPKGEEYQAGDTFTVTTGLDDPVVRQLRRLGAIKMPSEVLPAEEVAAQLARLADLERQVAEFRRMQAQGAPVDDLLAEISAATGQPAKRGGTK